MNTLLPVIPEADDSSLALPLIVAQKWSFPLAHHQTDEGIFYAVQDWLRGITGETNVKLTFSRMKSQRSPITMKSKIILTRILLQRNQESRKASPNCTIRLRNYLMKN